MPKAQVIPKDIEECLVKKEITAKEYCECLIRATKVGFDIQPKHIQIILNKLEKQNEERS